MLHFTSLPPSLVMSHPSFNPSHHYSLACHFTPPSLTPLIHSTFTYTSHSLHLHLFFSIIPPSLLSFAPPSLTPLIHSTFTYSSFTPPSLTPLIHSTFTPSLLHSFLSTLHLHISFVHSILPSVCHSTSLNAISIGMLSEHGRQRQPTATGTLARFR